MKDLKSLFIKSGFLDVSTYLHSGNVVFSLDKKENTKTIEKKIESIVEKKYNFHVSIVVIEKEEYCHIVDKNPFLNHAQYDISKAYLTLLKKPILEENMSQLNKLTLDKEKVVLGKKCLYILFNTKISDSKLNNNSIEKALKTVATTRNWKTSTKIVEML